MFESLHIGFIGGGNMGEALIKGLLSASPLLPDQISIYDVSTTRMKYLEATYKIRLSANAADLAASSDVLILAVKPQTMSEVLGGIQAHLSHRPLVISIAAGISLAVLSAGLPEGTPIVRVMPNTPALVLQGASTLARGTHVTDQQMEVALAFFQAVGKAIEVQEQWMDAVTGLSGSGPAYVLLIIESLIDAGVLMGLPRQTARELTLQTLLGTVSMVQETAKHPAALKDLITSPGGTTIRGLQVLEDRGVRGALMEAVEAATLRSRELGRS
ncbi:pyrroline-5-carboxylate reductase [Desulforhabdus amnigena]|jgi:pyrroline-5-carboxylate reductase|uniref:Pyrroline-5-carboxylate reductase n=1 Tax=Desulforhabdus amnigena TaxID=40218 RepID=A0A9W6FTW7_9BACT|nr:pyrroline-5-carboxylate reductase [Desulforhabdus amnigena]NLJ26918.1 pyrroline-5-carboxylate reductase [Deltaproteobacteria bacterium]GLI34506.1 pyrroline-5-carboxylate reductase [Desulforhabdus amnigena]